MTKKSKTPGNKISLRVPGGANGRFRNSSLKDVFDDGGYDENGWGFLHSAIQSRIPYTSSFDDPKLDYNHQDVFGQSVLMVWVCSSPPTDKRKILEKNIVLDAVDNNGRTALMYACSANDEMANMLLDAGCRMDIRDNSGHDAEYYCAKRYPELLKRIKAIKENEIVNSMIDAKTYNPNNKIKIL